MSEANLSTYRVLTAAQLRALASPERACILDELRELKSATVNELTARVNLRAGALHYHLRKLEQSGLVRVAGRRPTARRPQLEFALTAERIVLDPKQNTPAFRREKTRAARLYLRRAERELAEALQRGIDDRSSDQCARITRLQACLSTAEIARIRELLDQIRQVFRNAREGPDKKLQALTVAFTTIAASTPRKPR